jgi:hypothetical protein
MIRAAQRLLAAGALAVALGIAGAGCPSRALSVEISTDGAGTVSLACESFRDACGTPKACARNPLVCLSDGASCKLRNGCDLPGNPEWAPTLTMGLSLALVEATGKGLALRRRSACVPLNFRRCVKDPTGLVGCPDGAADLEGCVTSTLVAAVDDALGAGLTFDGFESPDEVILTALFFHKPGDEASCDPAVTVSPEDCTAGSLVAAAGMAAPLGKSTYDITCASCQSGPHGSLGRDNGACPVTGQQCFLQRIADLLAAKGP